MTQVVKFEIRHGMRTMDKILALEKEVDLLQRYLTDVRAECERLKHQLSEIRKKGAA